MGGRNNCYHSVFVAVEFSTQAIPVMQQKSMANTRFIGIVARVNFGLELS